MAELQWQQKTEAEEEALILRNQLRAMTWAAQAKDESMRQMQAKLKEAETRAMELEQRLNAALAREKTLIQSLEAALDAEERLAADMASLESESLHQAMDLASLRTQFEKQRRSSEAEAMAMKTEMDALLRRAEGAEMAEDRLAEQICHLEAELHQLLKESSMPRHVHNGLIPRHVHNDQMPRHAQENFKADILHKAQMEPSQESNSNIVVILPQQDKQQKQANNNPIDPQLALQEVFLAFGLQLKLWKNASLGIGNPKQHPTCHKLVAHEPILDV